MNEVIENNEVKSVRNLIDEFLELKRFAFIGVSSNRKSFSRMVFREFIKRDYDVVPVNPNADLIENGKTYSKVQEIETPVDGAFLMTPKNITKNVVQDCIDANINRIWLHKGIGKGSVHEDAILLCKENEIDVVPGYCPFMIIFVYTNTCSAVSVRCRHPLASNNNLFSYENVLPSCSSIH